MKINKLLIGGLLVWSSLAQAENITKNTAQMQAMDKITGRVSMINVPVGGMVKFGTFSIVVRDCQTRPAEEAPDNFAFVDISDNTLDGKEYNVFKGWMISSSPATNAVEHPIYDVWLIKCIDKKVDKSLLLSEAELAKHDSLPKYDLDEETTHNKENTEQINVMEYENENTETGDSASQNMVFEMDEESIENPEDTEPEDISETND